VFVSWIALPVDARMCAKKSGDETPAASSSRFRSFQAGCVLRYSRGRSSSSYQPTPKPSPFVVVAPEPRVQALVDQRAVALDEQLLEPDR
jgi:hypothetical protein